MEAHTAAEIDQGPWGVMILTFKGVDTVLWDGGIQSFPVNRERASELPYCVVVRNQNNHDHKAEDDRPHGSAFMIGKIKEVVPSTEPGVIAEEAKPGFKGRRRSLIIFSEYAILEDPRDVWALHGSRYSAQYRPLSVLGIDPSKLEWKPMPSNMEKAASGADPTAGYDHEYDEGKDTEEAPESIIPAVAEETIAERSRRVVNEAKAMVAAHFGVKPEMVTIDVRHTY